MCNLYANVVALVASVLSAIKSPSKPEAMFAFLANTLELSSPLIVVAVAHDSMILTCSMPRTLTSRADELCVLDFTSCFRWVLLSRDAV
jgi:mTERF domain-containing protein, mitochondrial